MNVDAWRVIVYRAAQNHMTSAAAPRRIAPTIHWLKSWVTPTMASTAASGYDGAHTILSEYRASAPGVADIVIPIFSNGALILADVLDGGGRTLGSGGDRRRTLRRP